MRSFQRKFITGESDQTCKSASLATQQDSFKISSVWYQRNNGRVFKRLFSASLAMLLALTLCSPTSLAFANEQLKAGASQGSSQLSISSQLSSQLTANEAQGTTLPVPPVSDEPNPADNAPNPSNSEDESAGNTPSPNAEQSAEQDDKEQAAGGDSEQSDIENTDDADEPPAPYDTPLAEGTYYIRTAVSTTRFIDISGGSSQSGATAQIYQLNKTPAQRFSLKIDAETGLYTLFTGTGSNLALDVTGASTNSGTKIQQYRSNQTKAQQWQISEDPARPGYYLIKSALSSDERSLVLDVAGAANANGTRLLSYLQNGTAAQSFSFFPLDYSHPSTKTLAEGIYQIGPAAAPSLVMDVPGASENSGTAMQLYASNKTLAQMFAVKWNATSDNQGYYTITSMVSGHAMDARGAGIISGTQIWQYSPNGTSAQQWALEAGSTRTGSFTVRAINSGLAWDIPGANYTSAQGIQLYLKNSTAAQDFVFTPVQASAAFSNIVAITPRLASDRRIDVAGASLQEGALVQTYTNNNTLAQRFQALPAGPANRYALRSVVSGRYLADTAIPGATGSVVAGSLGPALPTGTQELWDVELTTGGFILTNVASGNALTLDGTSLITTGKSGQPAASPALPREGVRAAQCFRITNSTITLSGYNTLLTPSGLTLDVQGGSRGNGAPLQLYADNNTNAQKFKIETYGNGNIKITNALSRKALDITGGSTALGAAIQQYRDNGTNAQRFIPVPSGDGWFYLKTLSGNYLAAGSYSKNAPLFVGTLEQALKFRFRSTSFSLSATDAAVIAREGLNSASSAHWVTTFGGYTPSASVTNQLNQAVAQICSGGYDCSVLMVDIYTGQGVAYNPDGVFYAASTVKSPYLAAVSAGDSGALNFYWSYFSSTISWSSNDAYSYLYLRYGNGPFQNWAAKTGVPGSRVAAQWNWYSSRDLAKLWTGNYEYFFGGSSNGTSLANLHRYTASSALSNSLANSYPVYSKAGWYPAGTYAAANDAGIIWAEDRPYLVSILSNRPAQTDYLNSMAYALNAAHREML